jgi:hypothetical protein
MEKLRGMSLTIPYTAIEDGKEVQREVHAIHIGRLMPDLPSEGDIVEARKRKDGAAGEMGGVLEIETSQS